MKHTMGLQPIPFDLIRNGNKTVELRVYDEKRRNVNIGDTIEFTCNDDSITVVVTGLYISDTFENLFQMFDINAAGLPDTETALSVMSKFYPIEFQNQHGVVGIQIKLK